MADRPARSKGMQALLAQMQQNSIDNPSPNKETIVDTVINQAIEVETISEPKAPTENPISNEELKEEIKKEPALSKPASPSKKLKTQKKASEQSSEEKNTKPVIAENNLMELFAGNKKINKTVHINILCTEQAKANVQKYAELLQFRSTNDFINSIFENLNDECILAMFQKR